MKSVRPDGPGALDLKVNKRPMPGLLNDITNDPANISLRLQYADAVEQDGDHQYAGFIRLQCQLADASDGSIEQRALHQQTEALLAEYGDLWVRQYSLPAYVVNAFWHLGLVEELVIDIEIFDGNLQLALDKAPVSTLSLIDNEELAGLKSFVADPALARVKHLDLTETTLAVYGATVLFSFGQFDQLESIVFSDDDSQPDVMREFIKGYFPSLTRVRCSGYISANLGNEGIQLLAESTLWSQLTELELFNVRLDSQAAQVFTLPDGLTELTRLSLGGGGYSKNSLSENGAQELANAPNLQNLRFLDLGFNDIGDRGFEYLAKSEYLANVEELHLQANEISHDSFVYISVSKFLHNVCVLDLSHNDLCDRAVESLVLAAPMQVTTLWLYHNDIKDRGVRMIANAPMTQQLVELNLAQTGMTDQGAQSLLDSEYLVQIQTLFLGLNDFSDEMKIQLANRFGEVIVDKL
ncbi:MAG: hypothetical protein NPIRA05_10460 [Nitrospirales bacterium]|nr:MAG: hypothetical protein NPIRA05_10460 [Nitrospirales bacterium]